MAGRRLWLVLTVTICFSLAAPPRAIAEPFLAAYAGVALLENKDLDTELNLDFGGGPVSIVDGKLQDLEFNTSVVFGGKAGYFFERPVLGGNLGLELEAYHFEPNVDAQRVRFSGTAPGAPTNADVQKADVDVTVVGLNGLYRLPLAQSPEFLHGRVQPYLGVGVGLFIATLSTTTTALDTTKHIDDTDVQPGLQAIAGAKLFLTPHIAVFGEYKFTQTTDFAFHFRVRGTNVGFPVTEVATDRTDLTGHFVSGGIAYHW